MNKSSSLLEYQLSNRQIETLDLLSKGYTNKEIANFLNIKVNTVKIHVAKILDKLNVTNRTEATSVYNTSFNNENTCFPFIQVQTFINNDEEKYSKLTESFSEDLIIRLSDWCCFSIIAKDELVDFRLHKFGYTVSTSITFNKSEVELTCTSYEYESKIIVYKNKFVIPLSEFRNNKENIFIKLSALLIPELRKAERRRIKLNPSLQTTIWGKLVEGLHLIIDRTSVSVNEALILFSDILTEKKNYVLAYYGLVECYYIMISLQFLNNNRDELLDNLHEAAKSCYRINDRGFYGLFSMGLMNISISKPVKAAEYFEEAIIANPSFEDSYVLLSHVYLMLDRIEDGINCMEKLMSINAITVKFGINRGCMSLLYFAAERYQDAVDSSLACLQVIDNEPFMLLILISSYVYMEKYEEAKKNAELLKEHNPTFSFENLKITLEPFKKEHSDRLLKGLNRAGLFIHETIK